MSVQTISANQSNMTAANLSDGSSNWNGRSVVVADRAYQNKQQIEAGMGPGMFNDLGKGLVTIAILFAVAVAAVSAVVTLGIATASWQPALIVGGVICGGALLFGCLCNCR